MNKFQPPGKFKVIKGTVLTPETTGLSLVLNVVNMGGKTDDAIYKLFEKKWPRVKSETRNQWINKNGFYKLGTVDTVLVQSDAWVINMRCQDENSQTDLNAVENCLKKVYDMAKSEKASVHISSALMSSVPELADLAKKALTDNGIYVYFYEEPKTK